MNVLMKRILFMVFIFGAFASDKIQNTTSKYYGVCWSKNAKKWQATLYMSHNQKKIHGGCFDIEENAAMKINLLCDEYEIERKNPAIEIEPNVIQQDQNTTSKYNGVCWNKVKKKWQVQIRPNKKIYFGGYFDNEEHAAMKVNSLCDEYEIQRKNPAIEIEPNAIQQVRNQTSNYTGVSWNIKAKKWKAQFAHNKKQYFGGYFDIEEHAAMKVNLLCDEYEIEYKNPMINIDLDAIQQVKNQTSNYTGVCWEKDRKKWKAKLVHNKKLYFGGYFVHEEHAAMKVNLLCDEYEIEHKNPMININVNAIQQVQNQTSNYTGVSWNKDKKQWQVRLMHNKQKFYGGFFDIEEHAAMRANLLCDKLNIKRKNPMININLNEILQKKIYKSEAENIVEKEVKVEEENMLNGFKDECENRFMKTNDETKCISQSSNAKRKRKD